MEKDGNKRNTHAESENSLDATHSTRDLDSGLGEPPDDVSSELVHSLLPMFMVTITARF